MRWYNSIEKLKKLNHLGEFQTGSFRFTRWSFSPHRFGAFVYGPSNRGFGYIQLELSSNDDPVLSNGVLYDFCDKIEIKIHIKTVDGEIPEGTLLHAILDLMTNLIPHYEKLIKEEENILKLADFQEKVEFLKNLIAKAESSS